MSCWYFERSEIRNSPSLQDGIAARTESQYRMDGVRLIIDVGNNLHLRFKTWSTAAVYFHRFYMKRSFKSFDKYVTAVTCLLLAGKWEDNPKQCRQILRAARILLSGDIFLQSFGKEPKKQMVMMEKVLLKTLKFELEVDHSHLHLIRVAKMFENCNKEKVQKTLQMAWTFLNDSHCSTLCLQWEPEIVAVAVMYLAAKFTKFQPRNWSGRSASCGGTWWEDCLEGLTLDVMEDICHQILDLYPEGEAGGPRVTREDVTWKTSTSMEGQETVESVVERKRQAPWICDGAEASKCPRLDAEAHMSTLEVGSASSFSHHLHKIQNDS